MRRKIELVVGPGDSWRTICPREDALRSVNSLGQWGYTNTHITVHDTYSTQFQLRFKVFPELSGKVEYERERLNTVLKCGRPYK